MKLLLDTQAFIWFVDNDDRLPNKIKKQIDNINMELPEYGISRRETKPATKNL